MEMCIDYTKLDKAANPLPFPDEMLEPPENNSFFCFLDEYSAYHQIPIHPDDQSKTTFTCLYGTYVDRRMSFEICNAPALFQMVHDVYILRFDQRNHGKGHG